LITSKEADENTASTYGYCQILPWNKEAVNKNPLQVQLPDMFFSQRHRKASVVVNRQPAQIFFQMEATPLATPLVIPNTDYSADEFIGWGLLPGMDIAGKFCFGEREISLDKNWYCYHDHNYGRFRWGGSVGWLWWVVNVPAESNLANLTYVFHQGNPNAAEKGMPYLFVYENYHLIKVFSGTSLTVDIKWHEQEIHPIRLPGFLTPLFADRPTATLECIEVSGGDDADEIDLRMTVLSNVEIILPDNKKRQYTFLKETNGKTEVYHRINGNTIQSTKGQFYAEYAC
jgi:hypothetical protein